MVVPVRIPDDPCLLANFLCILQVADWEEQEEGEQGGAKVAYPARARAAWEFLTDDLLKKVGHSPPR